MTVFRLIIMQNEKVIQDIETEAIAAAVDDPENGGTRSILVAGTLNMIRMFNIALVLEQIRNKIISSRKEVKELYDNKDKFFKSQMAIDFGMLMKLKELREEADGSETE